MTSLNHSLHVAVPTAFDHAERLDTKKTIAHILQLQKQGIKSVLVCGSTGEQHSLTLTEKKQLLHALAQETSWAADFEVLFGLAGIVFHETVALAEAISKNPRIDGVVLGFPPYLCLTQKEAVLYAQGLIHTCEKPVILYNNPRRTGFDLSAESLLTLIADPRVIGLKEAGRKERVPQLKTKTAADFRFYAGGEADLAEKVALGFNGLSSMGGNLCPKEIQVIWHGLLKGDATISTSNEWQNMEQAAAGDPTNTISYLPWLKQQITIDGQPFGFCRQPLGLATIDRFGTGSIPPHLAHERQENQTNED